MAQRVSEPMFSVALEGSQVPTPPSVALVSTVAPRTFHFQAQGNPGIFGHHLATVPPGTVTESVTVTTSRVPETLYNVLGLVLDSPTVTAPPDVGFRPVG